MILSKFIEGLNILKPYYNDGDGYHLGAERDEFYAYKTDNPLSDEDFKKMRSLGWFQTQDDGDDSDSYDPEEGWMAFV